MTYFQTQYKIGIPKITNLLDTTSDNVSRYIAKKWIKVYNESGKVENR